MEDLPRVMGEQQRVSRSGQQTQEYRIQNGEGEYRWIRDETFLVHDADGQPSEIVRQLNPEELAEREQAIIDQVDRMAHIVNSCAGTLELDSESGRGTTLTIRLPPHEEA